MDRHARSKCCAELLHAAISDWAYQLITSHMLMLMTYLMLQVVVHGRRD